MGVTPTTTMYSGGCPHAGYPAWEYQNIPVKKRETAGADAEQRFQMHVADIRFFVTVNIGHEPTTHNFGWCPDAQIHPTWPSGFNLSITRGTPGYPGTPGDKLFIIWPLL